MEEKINQDGYCWLLEQMVDGIFDEKTKHLRKYFSILWHKKIYSAMCIVWWTSNLSNSYKHKREATMWTCVMVKSVTMATPLNRA